MASPAMQQLPSYKYRTLCILWWINKYKNLLNERSKNKDQSLAKSLVFNLGFYLINGAKKRGWRKVIVWETGLTLLLAGELDRFGIKIKKAGGHFTGVALWWQPGQRPPRSHQRGEPVLVWPDGWQLSSLERGEIGHSPNLTSTLNTPHLPSPLLSSCRSIAVYCSIAGYKECKKMRYFLLI